MRRAARELMRRFDVRAASEDVAFGGLSGGNQQKAVLARELTQDGLALLVAAQPTRGLDVGAVDAVYGHIRAARDAGVARAADLVRTRRTAGGGRPHRGAVPRPHHGRLARPAPTSANASAP